MIFFKNKKTTYQPHRFVTGFTMIETIAAISIGMFVAIMLVGVTTAGFKQIKHSHNSQRLHANAIFIIDTFTYWMKQGSDFGPNTDTDTLDIKLFDGAIKTLAKTDNAITLDGNAITADDIEITQLAFTRLARSARIEFRMKREGFDETFDAATTVALRND